MDDIVAAPVEPEAASEAALGEAPPPAPPPPPMAPPPVAAGVGGDVGLSSATGCAPLAFTALGAALLGAVLALAMLAYVNNGTLEFAPATALVAPKAGMTPPATPDLRPVAAPLETRAAAAQATARALAGSVATLEAEQGALSRRLDIALTALGLPGLAGRRPAATAPPTAPRATATSTARPTARPR